MLRTLVEDEVGFHVERGKRRNLLNSAGSDIRKGTLGHRSTTRALTDCYVLRDDGTRYIIKRSTGARRVNPATIEERGTVRTKHLNPARHGIEAYLPYVGRFPNVLTLYRQRPTTAINVNINTGAGRGW